MNSIKLRRLGVLPRIGIGAVLLTLIGGVASAGAFMAMHQANRDERPQLSIDDIRAHFHGIRTPSVLLESLEGGHPDTLDASAREALITWLESDRVSESYDDFDLGDSAPAEILAVSCIDCHSRASTGPDTAPDLPLEYWDDIRSIAFSTDISPVDVEILAASTHTHALSLSVLSIVVFALLLATSWPRRFVGALIAAVGIALFLDIGAWWVARSFDSWAYVIALAGFVFNGGVALACLAILADLAMPRLPPEET